MEFSLPPALEGRGALPWTLIEESSGVPEISRLSLDWARFGFFLSLISFLVGCAFGGAAAVFFFSGFSGAGHSTFCDRSIRSALIHSSSRLLNSS